MKMASSSVKSAFFSVILLVSLLGLIGLNLGCGAGGQTGQQPPPLAPTITGLPTSADALVGKTIILPFAVSGNPTSVTCSVSPGTCTVASDDASVSYAGAAPSSGDAWTATLKLTATNAGGSGTASSTISLGQITGVTVTGPSAAAMNMKPVYTAVVTGNGTYPTTVTWGLTPPNGMGSIVANPLTSSDEDTATYTPPQQASQIQGFPSVTITATAADGSTIGTIPVNLGVTSIAYFTPSGQQDDQTTGVGAVSATSAMAIVADQRPIPNSTEMAAGLALCDLKAGSCADAWSNRDSKNNLLPSQTEDMAAAGDGVTFYTTGEDGLPPTQATLSKAVLSGSALQVTTFVPDFQVATGTRAQGQLVQLGQDGNIYVAVNGDCPPGSSAQSGCVNVGGWVYEFSPTGSGEGDFPIASGFPMVITGMDVEPKFTLIQTNVLSATTGDILGPDLNLYVNGQLTGPQQSGYNIYDARVFMNGTGDQALVAGQYEVSATNRQFGIRSVAITNGLIDISLPSFFAAWDGGNSGAMSINVAWNAIPNPWGGGDVLGKCSSVGSTDPNGPTDGCLASWPGEPTPGSPTPLLYGLRLDTQHVPGGTISVLKGGRYWKDANGLWHLALWGNGSDGTICSSTPCTKVVVADVIPQQQSQSE
jgi:hypothetical protein